MAAQPEEDDEYPSDYYQELDENTLKDIKPTPEKWADPYEYPVYRKVSRAEWGAPAIPEDRMVALPHPITDVILSHTETPVCHTQDECKAALHDMVIDCQKRNIADVPYNFIVGGDGTVYEGRGWNWVPDPHPDHNDAFGKTMEIAHFGYFGRFPNQAQVDGSWDLVQEGIKEKYIALPPNYHPHYY